MSDKIKSQKTDKITINVEANEPNIDSNIDVSEAQKLDDLPEVGSEAEAAVIIEKVQATNKNVALEVSKPIAYDLAVKSFEDLTLGAQLAMFEHMSLDPTTGITTPALGLMKYQRARELGIPWANAVSHMHIIKGRVGLDINLCQAVLQRGKSGIIWQYIDEYKPLYNYITADGVTYLEDSFPPNIVKVNTFKDALEPGKIGVILAPTFVNNKPIYQPADYVTTIKFIRDKKDIKGDWITVTEIGQFKWSDALRANLVKEGGNWMMRPKFMIYKSAFWDGAKKIANDLLNGADDIDALNSIPD